MEKLQMCRICLVKHVRMYAVVNKNLHQLYERLTDVPFVTEDSRPMLACFFCCAKLKQCWRFQRKCLEAEELFTQTMNENYERNPLIYSGHLKFLNGFSTSPIEVISIFGDEQIPSLDVNEQVDEIDPEKESQTAEIKLEYEDISCPEVEYIPKHYAESSPRSELQETEIKTEVFVEREFIGELVMKKPTLGQGRARDIISAEKKISKFTKPLTKTTSNSPSNSDFNDIIMKYICEPSFNVQNLPEYTPNQTAKKRYQCDICQRSFNQRADLTRHCITHTGEKPFKCVICQSNFSQKTHLKRHIRTHTSQKSFKCDVCQRSCRDKCDLTRHSRTHTGEKPFKCHVCNSSFSTQSYLTYHIRIHSREKPFKCDICQRSFSLKSYLRSHIRKHMKA